MPEPQPPVTFPQRRLAVGTMNFGKRTPAPESARIVARALEHGLTFFDTANAYNDGESERILGRAIARAPGGRESVQIATKVGFGRNPGKPEGLGAVRVRAAIDESLGRLGTGYVDVYYLHAPDRKVPLEETLGAMHEVMKAGKARAWGISNYGAWEVLEMFALADAMGLPRPVVGQQLYNPLLRELDVEWFRFARTYGVHTMIYNPLAGGLLSGKHAGPGAEESKKGSRFDNNAMYQRRYWSKGMFERVHALTELAAKESLTVLELTYAWLAGQPGVDSILVGPGTVEHLDAAVAAASRPLSEALRKEVDALDVAFRGSDAHYVR